MMKEGNDGQVNHDQEELLVDVDAKGADNVEEALLVV